MGSWGRRTWGRPRGSFGVAIRLPYEQATNAVIADDAKLINFKYLFTRKILFPPSSAIPLIPGGSGTQDEGFEGDDHDPEKKI